MKKPLFVLFFLFSITIRSKETDFLSKDLLINFDEFFLDSDSKISEPNYTPLLNYSVDQFDQKIAYLFSDIGYQKRGNAYKNTDLLISGIKQNSILSYSSTPIFKALPYVAEKLLVGNSLFRDYVPYSSFNQSFHFYPRANNFKSELKAKYSSTNSAYTDAVNFIYASGMSESGWAFVASGSGRYGNEAYNSYISNAFDMDYHKGHLFESGAYFLSLGKEFSKRHAVNLALIGDYTLNTIKKPVQKEIYEVMQTNFYNPNWGKKVGEKKRIGNLTTNQHQAIFNHYWNFSKKTSLVNSISHSHIRLKLTDFDWRKAFNPYPDYYRKWPLYYKTESAQQSVIESYRKNSEQAQIQWDNIFSLNSNVATDSNGEKRSSFITMGHNRRTDELALSSDFYTEYGKLAVNIDGQFSFYTHQRYATVENLLGGDYWIDTDAVIVQNLGAASSQSQNDLNNIDRKVTEEDTYKYDYHISGFKPEIDLSLKYEHSDELFFNLKMHYANSQYWREGNYKNGLYPDNSEGESDKASFNEYQISLSSNYRYEKSHWFFVNVSLAQKAPLFDNLFYDPQRSNQLFSTIEEMQFFNTELTYLFAWNKITFKTSFFFNQSDNETLVYSSSYTNSLYGGSNIMGTMLFEDINTSEYGVDLGVELKVNKKLKINLLASHREHKYSNDPNWSNIQQNDNTYSSGKVRFDDLYVGNGPQNIASLGFDYASTKNYFISSSLSFVGNSYVKPTPYRRVAQILDSKLFKLTSVNDEQMKLDDYFKLDFSVGKRLNFSYFDLNISFNLSKDFSDNVALYTYEANEETEPKIFYKNNLNYFLNLEFEF